MATQTQFQGSQLPPTPLSPPSATLASPSAPLSPSGLGQPGGNISLMQASTPEPPKPKYLEPRTEFLLDWTLKVLGVAAAILFGIWAPISYKATADGNADNNASQEGLSSKLDDMNEQASSAASLQKTATSWQQYAASALSDLQEKMDGLATLRAWEFCDGRASDIAACSELSASVTIDEVITSLAGVGTPSPSESPTVEPTSTSEAPRTSRTLEPSASPGSTAGRGGPSLAVPAILGIVFGVLAFLGVVSGIFVWTRKVKRARARKWG